MTLKVLHTSDWHLGKKLFQEDLLSYQEEFLSWLLYTVKKEKIDILLIAGDIFDTPIPAANAQKAYFNFLSKVSSLCQTFIISGNHDSSALLSAPKALLEDKNIHIVSELENDLSRHCFTHSGVAIKVLPYFRNFEITKLAKLFNLDPTQEDIGLSALDSLINYWPKEYNKKMPKIFMGHHVFGSFLCAGSEHDLSFSGLESIPTHLFKDYDYLSLGHIHKYQKVSSSPLGIYCGSPYPLRFSESNHKFASLIEFKDGEQEVSKIEIPSFLKLHQLKLNEDNYQEKVKLFLEENKDPSFLEIFITLSTPQVGLVDNIRSLLEGSHCKLLSFIPRFKDKDSSSEIEVSRQYDIKTMFEAYCSETLPSGEQDLIIKEFKNLLQEVQDDLS